MDNNNYYYYGGYGYQPAPPMIPVKPLKPKLSAAGRKQVRKHYNRTMLLYFLMSLVFILYRIFSPQAYIMAIGISLTANAKYSTAVEYIMNNTALYRFLSILFVLMLEAMTVIIGSHFLKIDIPALFRPTKRTISMTLSSFSVSTAISMAAASAFAVILYLLSSFGNAELPESAFDTTPVSVGSTAWVLYVIYGCLLGPIFEELVFRGIFYKALSKYNRLTGIIFSSLLFALFHGNLQQFFYTFLGGIVFCYMLDYSGSIFPSILTHMICNTFNILIKESIIDIVSLPLPEIIDFEAYGISTPTYGMLISGALSLLVAAAGVVILIVLLAKKRIFPPKRSLPAKLSGLPMLLSSPLFYIGISIFAVETVITLY